MVTSAVLVTYCRHYYCLEEASNEEVGPLQLMNTTSKSSNSSSLSQQKYNRRGLQDDQDDNEDDGGDNAYDCPVEELETFNATIVLDLKIIKPPEGGAEDVAIPSSLTSTELSLLENILLRAYNSEEDEENDAALARRCDPQF